jgi:hypothetical protein
MRTVLTVITLIFPFACVALAQTAPATISMTAIDFGDVEVSSGSPVITLTVTNTSEVNMSLSDVNLVPGEQFNESAPPCEDVPPAGTCDFNVNFGPLAVGPHAAELEIQMSNMTSPFIVELSGYGTISALNDKIANATVLPLSYSETITNKNATSEVTDNDPRPTACESGDDSRNHTVWYSFAAPSNGWLLLGTKDSSFDTVVSVWTGTPGLLLPYACADDDGATIAANVNVPVSGGMTYYVMVAGKMASSSGVLHFSSSFQTDQAIKLGEVIAASVMPGQSSIFRTIVKFEGDTTLTVNVSPVASTIGCSATPTNLQFIGSGSARFTEVTIQCSTQGPSAGATTVTRPWLPMLGTLSLACLLWIPRKRAALLLLLVCAVLTVSCGGGGGQAENLGGSTTTGGTTGTTTPPPPAPSTAPGTYTVQLSGSPNPVTSSTMTLVVH